jgi:competence protein ComEA
MNLYNNRQLVVILVMVVVLFLFSSLNVASKKHEEETAVAGRPKFVYELRGDIRKGGFYCFNKEQTIDDLLRTCDGLKNDRVFAGDAFVKVKSGRKVIFRQGVEIEDMDAHARINFFLPVPVNLSSEEDLALIPGIGMKTAKAIISYRDKNNGIKDLQELTAVKGIGKKRLRLLMSYLTVEKLH